MSWPSGWIPIQWPGHGDFSSWMPFAVLLAQEKVHLGPYLNWSPWFPLWEITQESWDVAVPGGIRAS